MTDHPDLATFELFTIGALEDDAAFVAHVAGCDACSAVLRREARLELVLKDVPVRSRSGGRLLRFALPVVAVAAAAAVLFAVRGAGQRTVVTAEPVATQGMAIVPTIEDSPPTEDLAMTEAEANLADRKVLGKLMPSFRGCYDAGLAVDPTMHGRVRVDATIAPDGTVARAVVGEREGLSDEVATCLASVLANARFAPRVEGATVPFPLSFVWQGHR